jgi:hypothetical protein
VQKTQEDPLVQELIILEDLEVQPTKTTVEKLQLEYHQTTPIARQTQHDLVDLTEVLEAEVAAEVMVVVHAVVAEAVEDEEVINPNPNKNSLYNLSNYRTLIKCLTF